MQPDDADEIDSQLDRAIRIMKWKQWQEVAAPYFTMREIRVAIEAAIDLVGDASGNLAHQVKRCREEELRLLERCKAIDFALLWDSLGVYHHHAWHTTIDELKDDGQFKVAVPLSIAANAADAAMAIVLRQVAESGQGPVGLGSSSTTL